MSYFENIKKIKELGDKYNKECDKKDFVEDMMKCMTGASAIFVVINNVQISLTSHSDGFITCMCLIIISFLLLYTDIYLFKKLIKMRTQIEQLRQEIGESSGKYKRTADSNEGS